MLASRWIPAEPCSPHPFVRGCFWSVAGAAGGGGGGDRPGNEGELSGSSPAGPEHLLGMSPAWCPAPSAPVQLSLKGEKGVNGAYWDRG